MKKLLLLLPIMLLSLTSYSQYKKMDNPIMPGLILSLGGTSITVGAFLTPNEYTWVGTRNVQNQSNSNSGSWEVTPLYEQSAKFAGVCTGLTLTVTGLITLATTKKR